MAGENNVTPILPVIDMAILQEKANAYAMQGAEAAIKEFYTGYNSPYKKTLEETLNAKTVDVQFDIPDILGVMNNSISKIVDEIANTAVAKTFLPLVKNILTRADAEMKFSDILKFFIEYSDYENDRELSIDDYTVEITEDKGSFLYLTISEGINQVKIGFFDKSLKSDASKWYEIFTLPQVKLVKSGNSYSSSLKMMKLTIDDKTKLEIPFIPNVLEDDFTAFIARLIIANTKITFDTQDFDEDMFPEREHCHCD